jgi:hypothetical protein
VSDFRLIHFHGQRFSADHINQFHAESLFFIRQKLEESTSENQIVVSHHFPTFLNYPEQYKGSVLNDAFGVELSSGL